MDRIGHGYAATHSAELMGLLKSERVHLEACPGTALAESVEDAIRAFRDAGLSFGLNEDDPASYYGGCGFSCIEDIVQSCSGSGLDGSLAAKALCFKRRLTHPLHGPGLGFSTDDIEKAYVNARAAAFA